MKKTTKSILFLSALDFKEKSIQVIRKTPEAYVEAGWDVNYIVVRDNSKYDNYYYENEINPGGVNLIRVDLPLQSAINKFGSNRIVRRLLQKTAYFLAVLKLYALANEFLKINHVDVVYGYEVHGVLASNILKLFGKLKGRKLISRFQGVFYSYYYYYRKQYLKMILNFDHYLALYLPSDLCIMTNDGTQGDRLLRNIKSKNLTNYRFWVNGVDEQKLDRKKIKTLNISLNPNNDFIYLTVCRLDYWKRIDRGIRAVFELKQRYGIVDFIYYIVGEGGGREKLQSLVKDLNLENEVIFTGAIPNIEVKEYLNISDFFISTYDVSNVGNPLLEAIRSNKIIFTLNNGDTGEWIENKVNGFIYDINNTLFANMAADMYHVIQNEQYRNQLIRNIKMTEKNKLWTWTQRLNREIEEVEGLLE